MLQLIFSVTQLAYAIYVFENPSIALALAPLALLNIMVNSEYIIKVPGTNIAFNVKGALIPIASAIIITLARPLNGAYDTVMVLVGLATALSSACTMLMERMIAINVAVYVSLHYLASNILFAGNSLLPATLPLSVSLGVVVGSDIFHYLHVARKSSVTLVIGGAGERDAIYLSTLIIQLLEIVSKLLSPYIPAKL
jgi:uncharacterized membrane protein